jgi:hypothetical protein
MRLNLLLMAFAAFAFHSSCALAQPVIVTTTLDTNRLTLGASTTLRVYAQVAPEYRATAAQIFSWYIDLVVLGSNAVELVHSGLQRPTSDKDTLTSSAGTLDLQNVRGIHDTFLSRANAGVADPIELLSIPIKAIAPGLATIAVQAGTGVEDLEEDFIVEPVGDGPTFTGGNYTLARAEIRVTVPLTNLVATISQTALPENRGRLMTIRFPVLTGNIYAVEFSPGLGTAMTWQPLPNVPHNNGYADDTNSAPARFYRVKVIEGSTP